MDGPALIVEGAADRLLAKVEARTARVAVVGLGYVGLTAACALAAEGFSVVGIDTDRRRVDQVNMGICPFPLSEPDMHPLMAQQVKSERLSATTEHAACATADVVLLVVQTPIEGSSKLPSLEALKSAAAAVGSHLQRGVLVVVESTIPPETTEGLVVPLLESASGLSAADDFLVACCPERVMPGRLLANMQSCSRVVGGFTPQAAVAGAALYRCLTRGDVDLTDCTTAELVKTAENAYRDVQIAFANEVALLCEAYGADVYRVRELVNKSPRRDMHLPGAGVGGHCIPKDPWLLVANAPDSAAVRLIPASRAVNDGMPIHVGRLAEASLARHAQPLEDARIVVLGYAYLQDSDDARNSPSADLVGWLVQRHACVLVHDPLVPGFQIDLEQAVAGADCLILMVAHSAYQRLDLAQLGRGMRRRIVVDGRAVMAEAATAAGFDYCCIGIG
jgi:UDP-N-acetyl-D-mannosaminuronic acid dehydrogenase